ncbi:hypothetical protein DFQ26_002834 [Actinomortierella ambigua]|nr:hypothetical protein DFQ26_002834 [Actinomortierella ambigua]
MSTVYDRRALDCTATLPMISSLTNLAYQTSASPAVREFVSKDGGLERLVAILKKTPMTDRRNGLKWTLAFQCVVNIGVRGTERIRKRVVESGMILVTVKVLETFLEVLKQVREESERNQRMEAQANNGANNNSTSASAPVAPLVPPAPTTSVYSTNLPLALRENMTPHSHSSSPPHNGTTSNHASPRHIHATLPLPGQYSHTSQASAAMDVESGSHSTGSSIGSSTTTSSSSRRLISTETNDLGGLGAHASSLGNVSSRSSSSPSPERAQQPSPGGVLSASTLSREPINILGTQTTEEPQSMDTDPRLVPQAQQSLSQQQPQRQSHQFYFREDDILQCLQLLAYLSKYPSLRSAFNDTNGPNVFAIVEKFTHRAMHPLEIQYWAGVIMRNFCRKDDSRMGIRQCAYTGCGKWESKPREFAKCRRCRKAKYCSKQCQSKAWSDGHRWWCIERKPESMGVSSMYASDPPPAPPPPPPPAPDLQDQTEQEPTLSVNGGISSIGAPTGTRVVGGAGGSLAAIHHARGIRITDTPAPQGPTATGPSLHAPSPLPYLATGSSGHTSHPGQPQQQQQQRVDSGYAPVNSSPLNPTTHQQQPQPQPQSQQQQQQQSPAQPTTTPSMSAHSQTSPHAQPRQQSQHSHQLQQTALPQQQQPLQPTRPQASSVPPASSAGGSRPAFPPGAPTPEQLAQHFVCQVAQNPGQHNQLVQQLHEQFRRYYPVEQHAEAKRLFSLHARTYFASFQQMQNAAQAQQQPPRPLPTSIRGDAVFQPNSAPLRHAVDVSSSSNGPVSAPVSNLGHLPPYPGEAPSQANVPPAALGVVGAHGSNGSSNISISHSTTGISSGANRTPDRRRSYEDSDDEYGGPSTRTTSVPMLTQDLSSTTLSSFASEVVQTSPVEGRFPRMSLPETFGGSGSSSSSASASAFPSSTCATSANLHDSHPHPHHHHQPSWTPDTQVSSSKVARDYKVRKLMPSDEHDSNDGAVNPASVSNHHQVVGATAAQAPERSHHENGWSYSRQMAAQESHQHRPHHP